MYRSIHIQIYLGHPSPVMRIHRKALNKPLNIAFTPFFFIDRFHLLPHLTYYCVPIGCWDSKFQDKFSESHGKLVVSLAEPNTNCGNLG